MKMSKLFEIFEETKKQIMKDNSADWFEGTFCREECANSVALNALRRLEDNVRRGWLKEIRGKDD